MSDRDASGRFIPGNPTASKGGKARAAMLPPARRRAIAAAGFAAFVVKHFAGDRQAATSWLAARGQWAQDASYRAAGLGAFRDPGPLPF